MNKFYKKAFMSEAYNSNMPGYDKKKVERFKHNPDAFNIKGISNCSFYAKEVLFFKQIKRKDIKGAKTEQRIEVGKEQKAHCITRVQKDGMIMENYKIRKLTPIECERLQSLQDGFTEKGLNENNEEVLISNTQRYKALGNGFNCKVIEHIIKNL